MQTGFGKGHPNPFCQRRCILLYRSHRRQLQRLGDVLIHADRLGGLHILGKGVGGHGDNRHTLAVIARAAADGAGRVVAIHPRHLNVHEHHVVISVGAGG